MGDGELLGCVMCEGVGVGYLSGVWGRSGGVFAGVCEWVVRLLGY